MSLTKGEYQIFYRKRNPEKTRKIAREWAAKRRRQVDVLKNVPCIDCKKYFPPECMDFDHVRGEKEFVVSLSNRRSWSGLLKEIEKCDIVCSNCHRIRTRKRRN